MSAHVNAPKASSTVIRLIAIHTVPRESWKFSAGFPANAMDTGNQTAAAISAARDISRTKLSGELSASAAPAAEQRPAAVRALPSGRPPGSISTIYGAPALREMIANAVTVSSRRTILFDMIMTTREAYPIAGSEWLGKRITCGGAP